MKFADRYFGIPLVFILSLFYGLYKSFFDKSKSSLKPDVKRIAFVKTAAIGDTVMMAFAVKAVRNALPFTQLDIICGTDNAEAVDVLCKPDKTLIINPKQPSMAFVNVFNLDKYDVVIDFGAWPRFDALITWLTPAGTRYGFETHSQHRHFLYDKTVMHFDNRHEYENYSALLNEALGFTSAPLNSFYEESEKEKAVILHMFAGGSGREMKEWSTEHWAELARLIYESGYKIYVTASAEDLPKAKNFVNGLSFPAEVFGGHSLGKLKEKIVSCEVVISVNTGIMHLAAAVGTKVIGLSGPTDVVRWGALGDRAVNIQSGAKCAPCLNLGFEFENCPENCMNEIKTDDVFIAFKRLTGVQL